LEYKRRPDKEGIFRLKVEQLKHELLYTSLRQNDRRTKTDVQVGTRAYDRLEDGK